MKVESILDAKGRRVETVPPDAQLQMVVHKLISLGIGSLVVSDDGRKFQGMVSERDVVRGLNRHGAQVLELRAKDVMTRSSPTCSAGDTLQHVMALMTRSRHRHVPVLDEKGELDGILSIGDVVKHRLEEMELETNVLRQAYLLRR